MLSSVRSHQLPAARRRLAGWSRPGLVAVVVAGLLAPAVGQVGSRPVAGPPFVGVPAALAADNGGRRAQRAAQAQEADGASVPTAPPEPPAPVAPDDGAAFLAAADVPPFAWEPVAEATEYQVVLNGGDRTGPWLARTRWQPGDLGEGEWTWQVRARNAAGESPLSAERTIAVGGDPATPAAEPPAAAADAAATSAPEAGAPAPDAAATPAAAPDRGNGGRGGADDAPDADADADADRDDAPDGEEGSVPATAGNPIWAPDGGYVPDWSTIGGVAPPDQGIVVGGDERLQARADRLRERAGSAPGSGVGGGAPPSGASDGAETATSTGGSADAADGAGGAADGASDGADDRTADGSTSGGADRARDRGNDGAGDDAADSDAAATADGTITTTDPADGDGDQGGGTSAPEGSEPDRPADRIQGFEAVGDGAERLGRDAASGVTAAQDGAPASDSTDAPDPVADPAAASDRDADRGDATDPEPNRAPDPSPEAAPSAGEDGEVETPRGDASSLPPRVVKLLPNPAAFGIAPDAARRDRRDRDADRAGGDDRSRGEEPTAGRSDRRDEEHADREPADGDRDRRDDGGDRNDLADPDGGVQTDPADPGEGDGRDVIGDGDEVGDRNDAGGVDDGNDGDHDRAPDEDRRDEPPVDDRNEPVGDHTPTAPAEPEPPTPALPDAAPEPTPAPTMASAPEPTPAPEEPREPAPAAVVTPAASPSATPSVAPAATKLPVLTAPGADDQTPTPIPTPSPPSPAATDAPSPAASPSPPPTQPPAPVPADALTPTTTPAPTVALEPTPAPTGAPAGPPRELVFLPVADSSVDAAAPDAPQPPAQASVLPVGGPDQAAAYVTFLVEGVAPGTVVSAQLTVTGAIGFWGPVSVGVLPGYAVDEAGLTWNTAPGGEWPAAAADGSAAGIAGLPADQETTVDVSGAVGGDGLVTFVLRGTPDAGQAIGSRESGIPARLAVTAS